MTERLSVMRLFQASIEVVAGVALVSGALMPWITGASSVPGMQYGEGQLIFALGTIAVIFAVIGLFARRAAQQFVLALLQCEVAAFALVLSVHKLEELRDLSNILGFITPHIGHGVYVTLAGGSLLAATSLAGVVRGLWHVASGRLIAQPSS